MSSLDQEIAAFEATQADLEKRFMGKWVLIRGGQLQGTFNDFSEAAATAVKQFGRGPYLIRQVGAPPVTLPASVMYRFADARG